MADAEKPQFVASDGTVFDKKYKVKKCVAAPAPSRPRLPRPAAPVRRPSYAS